MATELGRRDFLKAAVVAAAGAAVAACGKGPTPAPESKKTEPTAVPPQKETPVPTPEEKEIVPTPTWEPQETQVSLLPDVGGQLIVGELVRANEIQPSEAEGLADNQKEQLNDALSKGREWVRYLVANGYGDEEDLKLCVAFGQTNAYAAKVEKATGYAEGTLFVEGKGNVLTIMPFSKGDKIRALGDKEGSFKGWALFDDKEQLIARVDQLTNRWLVGSGESEEYWLPKLKELGIDLSQVSAQERAAIAETVFYSLQATYGANFEWDKVNKGSWQVLAATENTSAKVLLINGDKQVFEHRWESEWGRQFDIKDQSGNWPGAWLTRLLTDVPGGEISFKDGQLQAVAKEDVYTFNWDRHEWELTPKSVAEATPQSTSTPVPTKEAIPTKEEPKEMVTSGNVELYEKADKNADTGAHLIAGKEFEVVERQGDWLRIEVTGANGAKWQRWIQKGGAYYPKGEAPPTPSSPEPSKRFPKEIILANGQVVIHNMGTKHGIVITDGGFRDVNGNFCPIVCEGQKGFDTGMRSDNTAFLNEVIRKYGGGKGTLEIFFYDNPQKDPYFDQSQKNEFMYRYGRQEGNVIQLHIGVNESFDPTFGGRNWQAICMAITAGGVVPFLEGDINFILYGTSKWGTQPADLTAIAMYSKFSVE